MPALAVTEHGNMFSSVVFHDHARERGLKPILGCEVYVAQGSRFDKSGPQTETNHLVLLAETDEGYKNLIKLVSAGYTEGFYYKPRIDKELLAQHAQGLIGLSSCLKGEVASALKVEQARPALEAAARLRDILGPDNFFLEMQYQGIEEQKIVNHGLAAAGARARTCRSSPPTTCTTSGRATTSRTTSCSASAPARRSTTRSACATRRPVLPEDRRADGGRLQGDYPEALKNTVRIAERCNVTIPKGQNHLPTFGVPEGFTLDQYFEHVAAGRIRAAAAPSAAARGGGRLRHTIDEYEHVSTTRSR